MVNASFLPGLISELLKLPHEIGWVEFKENYAEPEGIGEYLSSLSNMAALEGKASGYLVWGIKDGTHEVVGTSFNPFQSKKGNEDLQNWLMRMVEPEIFFQFHEVEYEEKPIVVLEISRANGRPIQFQGIEWIRIGSYQKKLKNHPEFERKLWRMFDSTPFENGIAEENQDAESVLKLLDYPSYFNLSEQPLPDGHEQILKGLEWDRLIISNHYGKWNITNLGAVLFAQNVNRFRTLSRKAVRVIVYDGKGRLKTQREQVGAKGYAVGFAGLIAFINALLPHNEVLGQAIRKDVPMFPELAIRELVANALIHQDFSITGNGPMVEIFDDRMEITNPGLPLVKTERFLDSPPHSRNESLASMMRRFGICEERGSGIDKVVFETELYQLPAPLFETNAESTRTVLFSHRPLRAMDRDDRLRACYLHACLQHVNRSRMTNGSLRKRFGIPEQNAATASRIIAEALEDKLIVPYDADQSKKYASYLPFWA